MRIVERRINVVRGRSPTHLFTFRITGTCPGLRMQYEMELNDVPISNARQSLADPPLYGCCSNVSIRTMADGGEGFYRHWPLSRVAESDRHAAATMSLSFPNGPLPRTSQRGGEIPY